MSALLLKGGPAAAALNEKTAARAAALTAGGVTPTLAVVRVGAREDDLAYERGVLARCGKLGIGVRPFQLDAGAGQAQLLEVLDQITRDRTIHGCLLFRPLPAPMDDRTVRAAIAPEKDVDGITDASLAGVFTGSGVGYAPCTAQACIEILDHYGIPLEGKRVAVVGRSLVVGKPVAMLLERRNATVTLCHSRTRDLPVLCRHRRAVDSQGVPVLLGQIHHLVPLPQAHKGQIFGDGQNPCHRFALRHIQMGSTADLQIGVHHHILRLMMIFGQRQRIAVDGAVGGTVQRFKSSLAAQCNLRQHLFQFLRIVGRTQRLEAVFHQHHCHEHLGWLPPHEKSFGDR